MKSNNKKLLKILIIIFVCIAYLFTMGLLALACAMDEWAEEYEWEEALIKIPDSDIWIVVSSRFLVHPGDTAVYALDKNNEKHLICNMNNFYLDDDALSSVTATNNQDGTFTLNFGSGHSRTMDMPSAFSLESEVR